MTSTHQVFKCTCSSLEHVMLLEQTEDGLLYFNVHLAPLPFFQRLKLAVKYIFGYRSRWGSFDEIILDNSTSLDLSDALYEAATGGQRPFEPNDVF